MKHYSIHFYKAIGAYCLFYVDDKTYEIVKIFSSKRSAVIYGYIHKLTVHND